jgi:hypothetical protein
MACCPSHPGISHPESLRGNGGAPIRPSNLTLGIALDALAQTSLGFHRFEPVIGIVSPLPWAMLLTRQGISLSKLLICLLFLFKSVVKMFLNIFTLYVATQNGLYLHQH